MSSMHAAMWLIGVALLGACVTPAAMPVQHELEQHTRCDPVSTLRVQARVDGARVVIESVITRQVCQGEPRHEPPERLAEIRLRPELPGCPIGQLGLRRWSLGSSTEPALAGFFGARTPAERARLELALSSFSNDVQAWVIGCPEGRPSEWLFVETPRTGLPQRVAFYDGDRVRFAPGHDNVAYPTPPPLPVPPPASPLPAASDQDESPEPPLAEAPRPTARGCPAERVDAQWVARRFTSRARPPGERSMPGPESKERWALRLEGGKATLVLEVEKRGLGASEWTCSDATTVQGELERRGRDLVLTFGGLVATCREAVLSLPPASAARRPRRLPQRPDEEGCDRYPWATAARVPTKVLQCTGTLPLDALPVFGAAPGIERLVLSNDCQEPGERGALRLVPVDGSVAPAM
ncbi:MAG: hypothetical protein JNJ54_09080 [Myxococcaceae bacterium]|nr:hypothetical protein [Myxococcaceae bacterium]